MRDTADWRSLKGTIFDSTGAAGGFSAVDLPDDFGDEIDEASPDCAF